MNVLDKKQWDRFVDLSGRSAQRVGFSRSLGQVWAALYLQPSPMSLQDLMDQLHISKGNASMSVRQLAEWGAVKRVWIKGDRKDYYQANDNFSEVLSHFLSILIKPRVESTGAQLSEIKENLSKSNGPEGKHSEFMRQRISKLETIQKRIGKLLPIAEKLLK